MKLVLQTEIDYPELFKRFDKDHFKDWKIKYIYSNERELAGSYDGDTKTITYNLNNYEHERTKGKIERTTIIHELQHEARTLLEQGKGSSIQKEFGIAEERIRGKAIRLVRRILIGDVAQENLSSAKRWLSDVNAYYKGEKNEDTERFVYRFFLVLTEYKKAQRAFEQSLS